MKVTRTIRDLREAINAYRSTGHRDACVGFVPTMGYLHEGHASLLQAARKQCGLVVLSIFVNPLQFGPNEDFARYPRDEERDLRIAAGNGTDVVFLPAVEEMYPKPVLTKVSVSGITSVLCGASRPGHFDGVATVVAKLFHLVQPDKAFFGMKDAQQVAVIMQMVEDLHFPVEIVPCPTVREADGLAKSSRNVYLSPEERKQAVVLSQALKQAQEWVRETGITTEELKRRIRSVIQQAPLANIDYVEVLRFPSLLPVDDLRAGSGDRIIVALAVRFGSTRLIDNTIISL